MTPWMRIDLRVPLDRFELRLGWETSETSLGLFGPSGAGKTTALETLAGLEPRARGTVRVHDRVWLDSSRGLALRPEERGVGYVPQDVRLFPHLDVLGNLLAGRRRAARSAPGRLTPERVMAVLELTGLERTTVASLSGGEKRRVALGRALLSAPELLLLGEPLAGLDAPLRDRVLTYLLRVREEFDLPTIFVSHDVTETKLLSREVAVLSSGEVVSRGSSEEVFLRPEVLPDAFAAGFENVLTGTVRAIEDGAARVVLEPGLGIVVPGDGLTAGQEVKTGLRAEDLILAVDAPARLSAQNVVPGRIRELREAAGTVLVVVEIGSGRRPLAATITPRARQRLALDPGMEVFLVWKAHACRVWVVR